MGNGLSCMCNKNESTDKNLHSDEVVIDGEQDKLQVKSANKIQNNFRRKKVYNNLVNDLYNQMTESGKIGITEEQFFSLIPKNILESCNKLRGEIDSLTTKNSQPGFIIKLNPFYIKEKEEYYYGTWNVKGERTGLGMNLGKDSSIYYGYFLNDNLHGFGLYLRDEDYYLGEWHLGKAEGQGTLVLSAGIKYKGMWKNNFKEGEGEEIYSDGSKYIGEFKQNDKDGRGVYTWPDGSYYKGHFEFSKFNGYGEYKWPDGRIYQGTWKDGKMNGRGLNVWPNGNYYEGEYKNDKKCGLGRYYWNNDKYYEGSWLNNKQHGEGSLYLKGRIYKGNWRFGKAINIQNVTEIVPVIEEEKTKNKDEEELLNKINAAAVKN